MEIVEPTKIKLNKRYPTFQFHGFISNNKSKPEFLLKLCVLETMSWLRKRLCKFENFPPEIKLPLPEDVDQLNNEMIRSFHFEYGYVIDVTYIKEDGIWSFYLNETDAGANFNTEKPRLPLLGRTFETNIAFKINNNKLEVGFQTVCTEPYDNNVDCEVFRPLVLKNIFLNPKLGLEHIWKLENKTVDIFTNSSFEDLIELIKNKERFIPVIIVTQPYKVICHKEEVNLEIKKELDIKSVTSSISLNHKQKELSEEEFKVIINDKIPKSKNLEKCTRLVKMKAEEKECVEKEIRETIEKLPTINSDKLAESLVGFAIVCNLKKKYFTQIQDKLKIKNIESGDIIIFYNDVVNEVIKYNETAKDIMEMQKSIKDNIKLYPKRNVVNFGEIVFNCDAKIIQLQNHNIENISKSDQIKNLKYENLELRQRINELKEEKTDCSFILHQNKILMKKNKELEMENSKHEESEFKLQEDVNVLRTSRDELIKSNNFYIEKIKHYSSFPEKIDEVEKWIDENFKDTILLHKNAISSLYKYKNHLNLNMLCDGIYFISMYSQYRKKDIPKNYLCYFAAPYNWEVSSSGKISMQNLEDSYKLKWRDINDNKVSRSMDLHIKNGNKSGNLIRIYFFWDEEREKSVLCHMPEHLPIISRKT